MDPFRPKSSERLAAMKLKATDTSIPFHSAVQNLSDFIETDAKAYMFFTQMFDQVPTFYSTSPDNRPQVKDYQEMLRLFNVIMTHAPEFNKTGVVGVPFNAILN